MNARAMPGFGDAATWPDCAGHPNDPRTPEPLGLSLHSLPVSNMLTPDCPRSSALLLAIVRVRLTDRANLEALGAAVDAFMAHRREDFARSFADDVAAQS